MEVSSIVKKDEETNLVLAQLVLWLIYASR